MTHLPVDKTALKVPFCSYLLWFSLRKKKGCPFLDNAVLSSRIPGHEEKAQDRKTKIEVEKKSIKKKKNIGKQRY